MSQASHAVERLTLGPVQNPVRGLLDLSAALLASTGAVFLWSQCAGHPQGRAAFLVFALSQAGLYAVSCLYHSAPWGPRWKRRMQRVDHAMIYLKIAGSLTPLALIGAAEWIRWPVLAAVWSIAVLGIVQKIFLPGLVHERASIPAQIAQATLALPVLVGFAQRFPGTPSLLVALGGACYALGAVVFLTERPRLWPRWFSFHDLFHVFVVAGGCAYLALVAGYLARA